MFEKIYVFTSIVLSLFIGCEIFSEWFLEFEPRGFESNIKYVTLAFALFMTVVMLFHIYATTYFVFTYIRMPNFKNKISKTIFHLTVFAIVVELIAFFMYKWHHDFYTYNHFILGREWDDLILLITSTAVLGTIMYLECNQTKKSP